MLESKYLGHIWFRFKDHFQFVCFKVITVSIKCVLETSLEITASAQLSKDAEAVKTWPFWCRISQTISLWVWAGEQQIVDKIKGDMLAQFSFNKIPPEQVHFAIQSRLKEYSYSLQVKVIHM